MEDIFKLNGYEILRSPLLNKGSAFTFKERTRFGLHGLLPAHISTMQEQVERRYKNFQDARSGIGKYIFLKNLQNRNEVLFYRLAHEHAEEMLPYIYTPTVGDASLDYSNIYADVRGIYLSYELKDQLDKILDHIPNKNVEAIVVTDGSRILGLGDVGVGGMTIPIGKLSLYTLFGGIHPGKTLPIFLDVGTDNEKLIADPLYMGAKHPRIKGKDYDDFIDVFVNAIKKKFPRVLLQWEDFSKNHARPLLDKYREHICSFNDDIQGTAAVALAAILGAVKSKKETLADQRIAILGGGSAGLGIADYILAAMKQAGIEEKEAYKKFFIVDINGLIHSQMSLSDVNQKRYAQEASVVTKWPVKEPSKITLEDVISNAKPTILLGVSAQPKTFTKSIIETMCSYCKRPLIFPLSNPTSRQEADPIDLIAWSKGQAIIATGSPAKPVEFQGKTYTIGQCNNVYIFPGVGLGVIASKPKKVTDEMFLKAANILSDYAPIVKDPYASIFPKIGDLRDIARHIGAEVALIAIKNHLAQVDEKNVTKLIENTVWFPDYENYEN